MDKITLAVSDDNKLFRNTLIDTLKSESDFEVILEAEDGLQLLESLKTIQPHIILMDIQMPKMNGMEASTKALELYPNIKIIAYSQHDNEANILEMYRRGVKSFIGKEANINELFSAIKTVYSGAVHVTTFASEIIQKNLSRLQPKPTLFSLTDIERLLLKLLSCGHSSTEIGGKLCQSARTIEKHREDLYKKFGVKNKEQLIVEAVRQSII